MKQKYSHLQPATGNHTAGICSVLLAPREWVESQIVTDFNTGSFANPVLLKPEYDFLRLELIPESFSFAENAKVSEAGQYWDTEISGETNNLDAETYQVLNSLRHHRFIAVVKDARGDKRVVGDNNNGLKLLFGFSASNKTMEHHIPISLTMQASKPAPYLLL